jgi:hypothetical protein
VLTSAIKSILPEGWTVDLWSGFGYSYDHSPRQLTYDNVSDFNITVHLEAPERDDWRDLKSDFAKISENISNLSEFQSNEMIKFFY